MLTPIRRVVTGHDPNGKAVVIHDGPAPNIVVSGSRPGGRTDIWRTGSPPANYDDDRDEGAADVAFPLEPAPGGTLFRICEYLPETKAAADVHHARRTGMHRTETVDYALVLEGEIVMVLDDEEVPLRAGDVLIQRATNHSWVNRTDKPARIAFILIDGVGADGKKRR